VPANIRGNTLQLPTTVVEETGDARTGSPSQRSVDSGASPHLGTSSHGSGIVMGLGLDARSSDHSPCSSEERKLSSGEGDGDGDGGDASPAQGTDTASPESCTRDTLADRQGSDLTTAAGTGTGVAMPTRPGRSNSSPAGPRSRNDERTASSPGRQSRLTSPDNSYVPFSAMDVGVVESIAASAGVCLHKALLFGDLRRS